MVRKAPFFGVDAPNASWSVAGHSPGSWTGWEVAISVDPSWALGRPLSGLGWIRCFEVALRVGEAIRSSGIRNIVGWGSFFSVLPLGGPLSRLTLGFSHRLVGVVWVGFSVTLVGNEGKLFCNERWVGLGPCGFGAVWYVGMPWMRIR